MPIEFENDAPVRLFESVEELARSDYLFRITDNGGATCDRYSVVISDGDCLGMSGAPSHPQGFSQWSESVDVGVFAEAVDEGREVDLAIGDLPPHIAQHVLRRINEGWQDSLDLALALDPSMVAPTREQAEQNEGLHTSGGFGIYRAGRGFCVRNDSRDAGDDAGPFMTVREALQATLPCACSLAGDEYQSTLDVGRTTADPEVAAKVAALEAKIDAQFEAERR